MAACQRRLTSVEVINYERVSFSKKKKEAGDVVGLDSGFIPAECRWKATPSAATRVMRVCVCVSLTSLHGEDAVFPYRRVFGDAASVNFLSKQTHVFMDPSRLVWRLLTGF